MQHSPQFLKLVNDAKTRVKETNVADVKRRMDAGEKFLLVDVREDNEWEKGHATQAVHLGKGILERDLESRFPDPNREIIMYCGGGYRSILTAATAQKMGYRNVSSLKGGFPLGLNGGLPASPPPPPPPGWPGPPRPSHCGYLPLASRRSMGSPPA